MQIKSLTTGAAVLLAFAQSALAGTAHVVNNCGIPVYYASVASNGNAGMQLMPAGGYSQTYTENGIGISIKLATSMTGPVTQLEFTLSGSKVSYDMSNINGYPFAAGGMSLVPSMQGDSDNPTCVAVDCAAGASVCAAAYNQPDDVRTLVCNSASDLTLTLCSGAAMKRDVTSAHLHRVHARHLPTRA